MKKPMALVPSLGLVMLGTVPVMAAGQTFAPVTGPAPVAGAPSISNPSKIDTSDLSTIQFPEPPNFGTLSDEELEEVEGEGFFGVVGGLVMAGDGVKEMVDSNSSVGERVWGAVKFVAGVFIAAASANPVTP